MRPYTIEEASVLVRFAFDQTLPALPGPGTPAFASLCRSLSPYGFSASGITVESPTSRLSDVSVVIALLSSRLLLRFLYDSVEIFVGNLRDDDLEPIAKILELSFAALAEITPDVPKGLLRIKHTAHLHLPPPEASSMLREHLRQQSSNFEADAFAYRIRWDDAPEIREARLTIANSVLYADSLYVEYNLGVRYATSDGPLPAAETFRKRYYQTLESVGLCCAEEDR